MKTKSTDSLVHNVKVFIRVRPEMDKSMSMEGDVLQIDSDRGVTLKPVEESEITPTKTTSTISKSTGTPHRTPKKAVDSSSRCVHYPLSSLSIPRSWNRKFVRI